MSDSNSPTVRYDVTYQGRVQGVGFRFTVQRFASSLEVLGFVRNLGNGDVSLIVEGKEQEIKSLLASVEAAMRRNIHGTQIDVRAATGEFSTFEIRY